MDCQLDCTERPLSTTSPRAHRARSPPPRCQDDVWYAGTVREFNLVTGEHLILYKDGVQDYEPLNGDLPWKPLASLGAAVDKVPPPGYFDEEYASVKKEEEAKAVKLEPGAIKIYKPVANAHAKDGTAVRIICGP